MVLACALTRGQAEATPVLIEWAEMAEDGYDLGASPFSDTDLDVEYRPDELGRLTVSLPEPRAPDAHDQPRPNDQIDRDTALERATALTRDLVAAGILVPGAFGDTPVHESTRVTGDGSTSWTTSYSFEFGFEHGGVVVVGPTLRVRIGSDGTPLEIGLADPDVSSVDTAVLTLDEASASEQFEELARATFPFPDQEYEFRVGGEKPVYVLDPGEADGTHEVRWMGVFAFDYNGTAGRPNVAALSMVSPDDGLTALTP
jgi:hypothetical protein